jgi:hydroxymethylbilane synthase
LKVRLGTRGSDLALWQAHHVAGRLACEAEVEIIVLKTKGDRIDDVPLSGVEGKAFFTAEIEQALLDRRVDLAVHSHKDLATENPAGLTVVAVPERGPTAEKLLVAPAAWDPDAPLLPVRQGASLGTSSPRRAEQVRALRPDLSVVSLRGNVPTRVRRLREGRFDAILLAAAGVERLALDLTGLQAVTLPTDLLVPAPAQGALALQVREGEEQLVALLRRHLHDPATQAAVDAERSLLAAAGGGCSLPLGALIRPHGEGYRMQAFLGADHPEPGHAPRWVIADGATPVEAAQAAMDRLRRRESTGAGPLAGVRVALIGSADHEHGSSLGERLSALGASVRHEAVIAFEDVEAPELGSLLAALRPGDAVAVTSREAARRLSGRSVPPGVTVAAVGASTARALEQSGWATDVVGAGGAAELADRLPVESGARVLFPCAETPRPDLAEALGRRGVRVEPVVLYRTVSLEAPALSADVDVRIYMSPSAVAATQRIEQEPAPLRLALGRSTAAALAEAGLAHERPAGSGSQAALNSLLARLRPAVTERP